MNSYSTVVFLNHFIEKALSALIFTTSCLWPRYIGNCHWYCIPFIYLFFSRPAFPPISFMYFYVADVRILKMFSVESANPYTLSQIILSQDWSKCNGIYCICLVSGPDIQLMFTVKKNIEN